MLAPVLLVMAVSLLIAVVATPVVRAAGRRLNAMDSAGVAGQVKAEARPIPNTGGIAIFAAIFAPLAGALAINRLGLGAAVSDLFPAFAAHLPGLNDIFAPAAVLLLSTLALHIVGLIDDRRPMGPWVKLAVMLLAAAVVAVWTDTRLFTMLDAPAGGVWASVVITIVWITVITNAFNFLDNMDGLAAGLAAIAAVCFMTTALVNDPPQWFVAGALASIAGACGGFLVFNFPWRTAGRGKGGAGGTAGGATIFMGDGGSLVLGFLLGVLSVRITYLPVGDADAAAGARANYHLLLIPVVILAVPLYDFISVLTIRLRQGRSPFVGDLQHFSHRLTGHGLSRRAAVLVIHGCAAATGIGAIAMPGLPAWQGALIGVQTLMILGVLAGYEWARAPSKRP